MVADLTAIVGSMNIIAGELTGRNDPAVFGKRKKEISAKMEQL
jgi:hypothetical protein